MVLEQYFCDTCEMRSSKFFLHVLTHTNSIW